MGGVCSSSDAAAVASAPSSSSFSSSSYSFSSTSSSSSSSSTTAKIVFPDGHLQEYPARVRVSQVLDKAGQALVVCSADDVTLEGHVPTARADDELRPGQLYFVLPSSVLRRRLRPEEIAELAVRASAALVGTGWSADDSGDEEAYNNVERTEEGEVIKRRRMRAARRMGSSNGRGRDFSSDLGAIAE